MSSTVLAVNRYFYSPNRQKVFEHQGFLQFLRRHSLLQGNILDIGCGDGQLTRHLFSMTPGGLLIGIDHNFNLLPISTSHANFVTASADTTLPFQSGTFDTIILSFVIHLILDWDNLFHEIHRLLSRRGSLIILTCSETDLCSRFLNKFCPELFSMDISRYRGITALRHVLTKTNFATIIIENVPNGKTILDDEYITRLNASCCSSLGLLKKAKREACLASVHSWIEASKQTGNTAVLRRTRTALLATKKD